MAITATADEEGWQPNNGRPVSTIARSFSAALDNAFLLTLNPELDTLSQSVAQKQQAVSTQKSELQSLEARLRETEARLQHQHQRQPSSSSPSTAAALGSITDPRNNNDNEESESEGPQLRQRPDGSFDPPNLNPRVAIESESSAGGGRDSEENAQGEDIAYLPVRDGNTTPEVGGPKNRYANGRFRRSVGRGKENLERATEGGMPTLRVAGHGKV